jgi:hypothetical protein
MIDEETNARLTTMIKFIVLEAQYRPVFYRALMDNGITIINYRKKHAARFVQAQHIDASWRSEAA